MEVYLITIKVKMKCLVPALPNEIMLDYNYGYVI